MDFSVVMLCKETARDLSKMQSGLRLRRWLAGFARSTEGLKETSVVVDVASQVDERKFVDIYCLDCSISLWVL